MKRKKLTAAALIAVTIAVFVTARAKDKATTAVASAAVVTPVWLPKLEMFSTTAALLMPILGVLWLSVQIYAKLAGLKRKSTTPTD